MKKFILGLFLGLSLALTGTVYADDIIESIVGKTVQGSFPVKIDGKQLIEQAAVIDGTSYLPVRAVGEALNKEVTFNADLGIELKNKVGADVVDQTKSSTQGNVSGVGYPDPPQVNIDTSTVTTEKDKNIYELQMKLSPIRARFLELETILSKYTGEGKEKDQAYNDALKENESLKMKYEELSKQIEELTKQ